MTAFEKWLKRNAAGDQNVLATALRILALQGGGGGRDLVFKWLAETGDETYTHETFQKAAKNLIAAWN